VWLPFALDGRDRIRETTVTRMGGDAGLPGRAAPSRGQLCRAIRRDRPKGGAAKITSLPSAIPPASAQVVPSGATVKEASTGHSPQRAFAFMSR
jgi:hypothetical protein